MLPVLSLGWSWSGTQNLLLGEPSRLCALGQAPCEAGERYQGLGTPSGKSPFFAEALKLPRKQWAPPGDLLGRSLGYLFPWGHVFWTGQAWSLDLWAQDLSPTPENTGYEPGVYLRSQGFSGIISLK
jgi:hypothetical protein